MINLIKEVKDNIREALLKGYSLSCEKGLLPEVEIFDIEIENTKEKNLVILQLILRLKCLNS